jgi:predicted transcriptional regulator
VTIGDVQGKPFSVAKIAAYMDVPPTTVIRRLNRLQSWGLIERQGRHYHLHQKGAQFSHRRAKLPMGAINSEQGY